MCVAIQAFWLCRREVLLWRAEWLVVRTLVLRRPLRAAEGAEIIASQHTSTSLPQNLPLCTCRGRSTAVAFAWSVLLESPARVKFRLLVVVELVPHVGLTRLGIAPVPRQNIVLLPRSTRGCRKSLSIAITRTNVIQSPPGSSASSPTTYNERVFMRQVQQHGEAERDDDDGFVQLNLEKPIVRWHACNS